MQVIPTGIENGMEGSDSSIPKVLAPVPLSERSWPPEIKGFLEQAKIESKRFVQEEPARTEWLASHMFRPSADLCVDGRVSDFTEALGLPTGILKPYRSAGGKSSSLESYIYAIRLRDFNRKIQRVNLDPGKTHRMSQLHFATVHYSASRPDHSCAAWSNHTEKAVMAMQEHTGALNADFSGSIVSFVTLIDTDLDALTVFAPRGKLNTAEISNMRKDGEDLRIAIREHLQELFPESWTPLTRLPEAHQTRFHDELAAMLADNVRFVRNVKSTGRPVELLVHQERLIFIGRPGETREHNTTFLIGDFESELLKYDFGIALGIVAKNLILDAVKHGNREWRIPVVITAPFDEDERALTVRYARGIRRKLEEVVPKLTNVGLDLLSTVKSRQGEFPEWVIDHCADLGRRICWCVTVNNRRTRTFYPVD